MFWKKTKTISREKFIEEQRIKFLSKLEKKVVSVPMHRKTTSILMKDGRKFVVEEEELLGKDKYLISLITF